MITKVNHAANGTVEAVMFSLRAGTKVLNRFDVLRRLSDLSDKQLHDVLVRLQKFKPEIAPAWKPEELQQLIQAKKDLLK